jgi:hypothetical protein
MKPQNQEEAAQCRIVGMYQQMLPEAPAQRDKNAPRSPLCGEYLVQVSKRQVTMAFPGSNSASRDHVKKTSKIAKAEELFVAMRSYRTQRN